MFTLKLRGDGQYFLDSLKVSVTAAWWFFWLFWRATYWSEYSMISKSGMFVKFVLCPLTYFKFLWNARERFILFGGLFICLFFPSVTRWFHSVVGYHSRFWFLRPGFESRWNLFFATVITVLSLAQMEVFWRLVNCQLRRASQSSNQTTSSQYICSLSLRCIQAMKVRSQPCKEHVARYYKLRQM